MLLKKLLVGALLAVAIAIPATAAVASEVLTDVFDGIAVTGAGSRMPVDINPSNITVRADGAVGIGYTYKAAGQARGDLGGTFQYVEHGYLFFRNPSDPTTFTGSRYDGGVITLTPTDDDLGPVSIADGDPRHYQAVQRQARVYAPDQLLTSYGEDLLHRLGLTPVNGIVNYGAFTFTTGQGTFWGVSTPDSRHFLLRLRFVVKPGEGSVRAPAVSRGDDGNLSSRFSNSEPGR